MRLLRAWASWSSSSPIRGVRPFSQFDHLSGAHPDAYGENDGYRAYGQPLTPAGVTERVSDALTSVGLPRLTLHWFRGAYATRLRRAGVDTSVIARLLGHSSVATTQRYIELVDTDLDMAVAKLPPLPSERHQPGSSRLVPSTAEAA